MNILNIFEIFFLKKEIDNLTCYDINNNKGYHEKFKLIMKSIDEEIAWKLLKPVCREIDELIEQKQMQFLSGYHNENDGIYVLKLQSNHLHFASRGLRDSIGDVAYKDGSLRIGLRSGGVPLNIFVQIT